MKICFKKKKKKKKKIKTRAQGEENNLIIPGNPHTLCKWACVRDVQPSKNTNKQKRVQVDFLAHGVKTI